MGGAALPVLGSTLTSLLLVSVLSCRQGGKKEVKSL